jgi:hypothetical protein
MGRALLVAYSELFCGGKGGGGSMVIFLEMAASRIQLKVRGSFSVIRITMLSGTSILILQACYLPPYL